jgi:sugar phosphate isomerase/epimerase
MTWRIGISSGACTEVPILDMLPALQGSGATAIEVGTPPRHFDPLQEHQIAALSQGLRDVLLEAVSIHAPFGGLLDLADPNPHHRHAAIGAILTAAGALKRLGGRLVIVHPSDLVRHAHDVPARLRDCAESLTILGDNCRATNVTLVVESPLPHLIGGHPDEFAWLLERVDDATRVCLDTGHAALGHHWHRFLEVAGSRLIHIHANDNHGHRDDHLPPGDGVLDWREIGQSLHAAKFAGWIMLELKCPPNDPAAYFRRAFEQASRLFGEISSSADIGTPGTGVAYHA